MEIAYALVPSERGKGYCTEAVEIMIDFLFLSKDVVRIQARTDVRNKGSQRVLEKSGFTREGKLRKSTFVRGRWRDWFIYSILREEWKAQSKKKQKRIPLQHPREQMVDIASHS
jgi:ribosomal-protein-alanine N-acetyltransferase